ncbi:Carbon-nitrogen hydrolase [Colletotrichum higginsianum IMI 349063]|uniref:Carbon-nitrogen hydrolase n=1 Tax=Colletotrichum higginsianum (strain IMI 349063) TaxID=759273 RepID=A0A1B7Y2N8_COLHI|nr:Carbon-nitrogen hydrolase [Colletotrichum higginsianum IMI 349063]OBR06275.1 Carbon-nitrogen hydrolase [Colletotrichum higginsianum IMI 349063]
MAIAAVGQITSTASLSHNLEQCVRLIAKAAAGGAKVLFLPEASDYIASSPQESLSLAQPQSKSPFVLGLQEAAKAHSVAISVGIHVPTDVPAEIADAAAAKDAKLLNRLLWINADGTINHAATYDKLHLFNLGAARESATIQAGTSLTAPFHTPVGRVGGLICFDLRFPEPALALTHPGPNSPFVDPAVGPAQILLYPSAFTIPTGQAHWETLLRARAIETQSWVFAAAQVGAHHPKRSSYGHSLVIDPWGQVRLELGGVDADGRAEEGAEGAIGFVDVDLEQWATVRERMPLTRRTLNPFLL